MWEEVTGFLHVVYFNNIFSQANENEFDDSKYYESLLKIRLHLSLQRKIIQPTVQLKLI